MVVYKYFVEVWELLPVEERTDRIDHHVTESKSFWKVEDAWNWVLDNNHKKFTLFKGEIIIDRS